MNARQGALLQTRNHVVHLRRFAIPECTMPRSDEPCVRTECRYHLSHRRKGEHQVRPTRDCALAVAEEGRHTLEEIAQISGLTREWVRQIEGRALAKLTRSDELRALHRDPENVRRAAFAFAREHAAQLGLPIRAVFDDSPRGDFARLGLFARLRATFPSMPAHAANELIRRLFTP